MLKSELLDELEKKHPNLNKNDIENIFDIFINTLITSLKNKQNIEIRGFGTLSSKLNKEKYVRNPKTEEKIFKKETRKLHFKIGKILHKKLNPQNE